jgi:LacI family transcriptional regulator
MAVNAPITSRDVAAHAGVSVGTVSNVLNRPDIVAASTRDRVHAAIKALGFVRNESARQLKAGRSRMIGLIVLDVANPFFTDVARGVEDEAAESGLAVMMCNSDGRLAGENGYLDLLEEHRVQGILVTPLSDDRQRIAELQARGTPVVLVDSRSSAGGQCSVAVDDVLGGDIAVTHLIETGHERIAFAGGPAGLRQVADRREGALRALARAGASSAELMLFETPGLNVAAGKEAGAAIAAIASQDRPTAVFCANDLVALGLLQEMTERKIRVPADIAIVGYDDIDFAAAAAVPLSSVRQPRQLIGRTAAQLLLEETADLDGHQHRQVIFQPELAVRRSSQRSPGSRVRRRRSPAAALARPAALTLPPRPTGPQITAHGPAHHLREQQILDPSRLIRISSSENMKRINPERCMRHPLAAAAGLGRMSAQCQTPCGTTRIPLGLQLAGVRISTCSSLAVIRLPGNRPARLKSDEGKHRFNCAYPAPIDGQKRIDHTGNR